LSTATGETYDIYHSQLVVPTLRFIEVGLPVSDNPDVADRIAWVVLADIVAPIDLPATLRPAIPV